MMQKQVPRTRSRSGQPATGPARGADSSAADARTIGVVKLAPRAGGLTSEEVDKEDSSCRKGREISWRDKAGHDLDDAETGHSGSAPRGALRWPVRLLTSTRAELARASTNACAARRHGKGQVQKRCQEGPFDDQGLRCVADLRGQCIRAARACIVGAEPWSTLAGAMPTSIGKQKLLDDAEYAEFMQWLKDGGAVVGILTQ
jgi:hypothetical protein